MQARISNLLTRGGTGPTAVQDGDPAERALHPSSHPRLYCPPYSVLQAMNRCRNALRTPEYGVSATSLPGEQRPINEVRGSLAWCPGQRNHPFMVCERKCDRLRGCQAPAQSGWSRHGLGVPGRQHAYEICLAPKNGESLHTYILPLCPLQFDKRCSVAFPLPLILQTQPHLFFYIVNAEHLPSGVAITVTVTVFCTPPPP